MNPRGDNGRWPELGSHLRGQEKQIGPLRENSFGDCPGGPVVKNPPVKAENMGSIPDLRRPHMPGSN